MRMENFGENQNRPPEEKMTYPEASEKLDAMVLKNIERGIEKKLEDASSANLLSGLKGKIIDPLYENAWLRGEPGIGQYERKEELKGFLQKSIREHYRTFFIPGHVNYDRERKTAKMTPPRGLGYETQVMLLKESGLIQNSQIEFFEAGKEALIPEKAPKNGLKIQADEGERQKYLNETRRDGRERRSVKAGPTAILYEILIKAGFFDKLDEVKKLEMMGAVLFADTIERNEWLEPTIDGFFDESKINLFKINRLLNHDQILEIMGDFLKDARVNWRDFNETRDRVRTILEKRASEPLTEDFIRRHGLEGAVKKQAENIRGSKIFLKSGKDAFRAEPRGKTSFELVYVKNPSGRWKNGSPERLPGQLPAVAAEAPRDDATGKPFWNQKSAYIEISDASFLAYVKKELSAELLKKAESYSERAGLNCQTAQIGGWMKIFIPFNGKLPSDFEGRLENNWLRLKKVPGGEEGKAPAAKTATGKYKKAANF